jgi:hypothetical protein
MAPWRQTARASVGRSRPAGCRVRAQKKGAGPKAGTGSSARVLPAPMRACAGAPDQRHAVRRSRSLAQRLGAALVLRSALVRSQRPDAGATVEAVPRVALQSAKLSRADHAAGRVGEEWRVALALLARVDGSGPSTQRPPVLGQAAVDFRMTSQTTERERSLQQPLPMSLG